MDGCKQIVKHTVDNSIIKPLDYALINEAGIAS